jgi:hypothetical protein
MLISLGFHSGGNATRQHHAERQFRQEISDIAGSPFNF